MNCRICLVKAVIFLLSLLQPVRAEDLPGFRKSTWFGEQVREQWLEHGIRVYANAAFNYDRGKPTRMIVFATPNGNSIEQTLGCGKAEGLDWHFDIQHVLAQVRLFRDQRPGENIVLFCTEAEGLSWPAWKNRTVQGPTVIRKAVEHLRDWLPAAEHTVILACHSGGGSFLFGYIDAHEAIPPYVDRFVFLDANYSYSDADRHGDKLLSWLNGKRSRRLIVVAYDDRDVKYQGKNIVSDTGGTFRATARMYDRFSQQLHFKVTHSEDFVHRISLDGQIALHVHSNPKIKILHTALVGEMNGLLHGLSDDWPAHRWGKFGGPRAYEKWIHPAPGIPKRSSQAISGTDFIARIQTMKRDERDNAIVEEICKGNIPTFLRSFQTVTAKIIDQQGKEHRVEYDVMPDYLAIGSDADFVRMPMSPHAAARIADAFGCSLPTRKMCDDIYQAAKLKVAPQPLTEKRESPSTFLQHHTLIEKQRINKAPGDLIGGIKKDVVLSNRIQEKPNRVALYGWHQLDGKPIQPLTVVHVNWYVDYSHGIRLVQRNVRINGRVMDLRHLLYSATLSPLVSDEGPITHPSY